MCQWLEWNRLGDAPSHAERLTDYAGAEGGIYEVNLHSKRGVSSLDPIATAKFIELTHEAYRMGLAQEAFDYVTGFFSDEVAFLDGHSVTFQSGGIPWSESFPKAYEERYGEALLPQLPLLFVEGACAARVRARYWELLTDALIDGFYKPIADWCAANDKLFTAHLKAEENPFFQLIYSGYVRSESAYKEKDDRQLATKGPFVITSTGELQGQNLVAEGLPFCGSPVRATKQLAIDDDQPSLKLHLPGVKADVVQVFINDEELGWCWGPDLCIELPNGLRAGVHQLSLNVVSSTYNSYGPHRHYEGDRYLTSPNQYSGAKNFADRPDAPAMTLGDLWHFVKWQVAGDLTISR